MSQLFVPGSKRTGSLSTACLRLVAMLSTCALTTMCANVAIADPMHGDHQQNFDIRNNPQKASARIAAKMTRGSKAAAVQAEMGATKEQLVKKLPGLELKVNEERGVPGMITTSKGALSDSRGKAADTVRAFVTENQKLFGISSANDQLKTKAAYANPENKLQWVNLKQEIGGIPVFQGELKALVNDKGELTAVTNELAAGLDDSVLKSTGGLTPEDALVAAAKDIHGEMKASSLVREKTSDDGHVIDFKSVGDFSMLRVSEVVFPYSIGEAEHAYQVVLRHDDEMYGIVVSSETGEVLYRKSLVNHQSQSASYLIYNGDSPAPGTPWPLPPVVNPIDSGCPVPGTQAVPTSQTQFTLISDNASASPDGWITDFENVSKGNNTWAGLDQQPPEGIDQGVIGVSQYSQASGNSSGPSLFNRNFLFTANPPPAGADAPAFGSMTDFNSAAVTNMFFWVNRYHDYLYRLGFTENAGNFQSKNFGRGGSDQDLILSQAQDWSGFNNANFGTPPDGQSGVMQMYRFTGTNGINRDGAMDNQVVLHELTHGLSNRLVGDAFGLDNQQGGGMGEGWSDFYSASILSEFPGGKDQDPNKVTPTGGWAFASGSYDNYYYGVRIFPYATNHVYNPMTYADTDPAQYYTKEDPAAVPESPRCLSKGGAKVHNLGNIWATILWQARAKVMESFDAARSLNGSFGGNQTTAWFEGNRHMLQMVTDGLKLTPNSPTFVEARDAILNAALAQVTTGPANWVSPDPANPAIAQLDEIELWRGFADRGLGYDAVSPPRNDFTTVELEPFNYYSISRSGCVGGTRTFGNPDPDDVLDELEDDDSFEFEFPAGETFSFYGNVYDRMWVNTNGSITFDGPDTDTEITAEHHFADPRISGWLADFDGASTQGTISITENFNSVTVLFKDMPEKSTVQEDGSGNHNSFEITLTYDDPFRLPLPVFGPFQIRYGTIEALQGITGLSAGPGNAFGPPVNLQALPPSEDLSAYGFCNPELPLSYFYEIFDDGSNPYDLNGLQFNYSWDFADGWTVSPTESYSHPLKALDPKIQNGSGSEVVNPGEEVTINIRLDSKLKKANLTNVLGLITPLTEGVTILDPVADYGDIPAGTSAAGLDSFRILLDPNELKCGQLVRLKVDFASDQGIVGVKDDVIFTVGTGFGDPQGSLTWPQGTPAGKLAANADAAATSVLLTNDAGTVNMKSALYLKNTRTNEIILATSWNNNTRLLGMRRAQKGTLAAAMQINDTLQFAGVPIPDAVQAGVKFEVKPNDPNITGPVGKVKVTLKNFYHPHIQDLRMTLTNASVIDAKYNVVLLEGAKARLDGTTTYNNITIDPDATLSVTNNNGLLDNTSYRPVGDLSVFADAGVNAGTTWTLTVSDMFSPFAGDFSGWSIELTPLITCPAETVQATNFDLGVSGWTTDHYGDMALMDSYYRPGTASVPAALVLNTKSDNSTRVPGFKSPGIYLDGMENAIYRFHAYVSRSGQPDLTSQAQIPFMRIRAAVGSVMTNIHSFLFNTTQLDPGANSYAMAIAPSTNPNQPSHYWVDFDPVDAPSLYADINHTVYGYIENWSHYPEQQGNIELVQARMERFAAPTDSEGPIVCTYTPQDLQNGAVWSGNLGNADWESDTPFGRPYVTKSSLGVTVDSSRVQAGGPVSFVTYDILPTNKQETIMKANKLYRVRYHVSSNTPSSGNPMFRMRARSLRWADVNEMVIGPSNFGSAREQLLGREILPGPGTQNPNNRGEETQGGYYDQYVSSPAVIPSNADFKTLRFGFDLFDLGYNGQGTSAQLKEGGRFTLDSIEVREFPQR